MRNLRLLSIMVLLCLAGCGTETTPTYQLSVSAEPVEAGTVEYAAQAEYEEGTTVNLTASPNPNWVFARWQGGATGSGNPVSVTMDTDKSVTAIFEKKQYALTVTTEGEGSVSEQDVQSKTDYDHGTTVQLTATPAEGWEFAGWEGDITGEENPATITVTEEANVTAIFEIKQFDLEVLVEGQGSIEQNAIQNKTTYDFGTVVQLEAVPEPGWVFSRWEGAVEDTSGTVELTIDGPKTVTAFFEEPEPELQLWACGFTCDESDSRTDQLRLPYSSNVSASISTTASVITVQRFFFRVVAGSFTIKNVIASEQNDRVNAEFQGIANGMVLEPGQDYEFAALSGKTGGQQVSLRYSFEIEETGDVFDMRVQLVSN
jgi:NOL1/NOP2/fmu family ribosome biogenesis protein